MTMLLKDIEQELLALSAKDRALIAEHILGSLDDDISSINEDAWMEEAERRLSEYRAGRMTSRPLEEVIADIGKLM